MCHQDKTIFLLDCLSFLSTDCRSIILFEKLIDGFHDCANLRRRFFGECHITLLACSVKVDAGSFVVVFWQSDLPRCFHRISMLGVIIRFCCRNHFLQEIFKFLQFLFRQPRPKLEDDLIVCLNTISLQQFLCRRYIRQAYWIEECHGLLP